jgi:hypothetical protein
MYFSLQYLSLADATVLTFLAPFCTAMAGAVLLGERVRLGNVVAGCELANRFSEEVQVLMGNRASTESCWGAAHREARIPVRRGC